MNEVAVDPVVISVRNYDEACACIKTMSAMITDLEKKVKEKNDRIEDYRVRLEKAESEEKELGRCLSQRIESTMNQGEEIAKQKKIINALKQTLCVVLGDSDGED